MTYELILTDKCTRNCRFCQIRQTGYVESLENIAKFASEVKVSSVDSYQISLFGGEPLLNIDGIKFAIDSFADDQRCKKIMIFTNGDLLDSVIGQDWIGKVEWNVSAYDIFFDKRKYESIIKLLGNSKSTIQYTFTEHDILKTEEFQEMLRGFTGMPKYKIAFSHSRSSWESISKEDLHDLVFETMTRELELSLEYFPEFRCLSIVQPLKSILGMTLLGGYKNGQLCCLDNRGDELSKKEVFYRGKFIGPCLQAKDVPKEDRHLKTVDAKCRICCYEPICLKSCFLELKKDSQEVDDKLCVIEKAKFDAICQSIAKHQYSRVWREILKEFL